MFLYQENQHYFAQIAGEMESLGEQELTELGAHDSSLGYRGIYFQADSEALYRMNYQSRLVSRILAPLIQFDCHSTKYLYKMAQTIDWTNLIKLDQTFAVFANVAHSKIQHSKYAALVIKDAIVDQFREQFELRPNVDSQNPDLWIGLHLENDRAMISLDTSGGPLHRRGYRVRAVEAPMQETLAAALVRLSGWSGETPLYDPMCGSGTILTEALMHYCRIPAAFKRSRFGFESLPDFDKKLWVKVKAEADSAVRELPEGLIQGSDISPAAVEIAQANSRNLPSGARIKFRVKDLFKSTGISDAVIISNPPYGIRMGEKDSLPAFYRDLGDFLKQRCTNSQAYIYFGERTYIKDVGLRTSFKIPLKNGPLDGRLVKYEMY